MNIFICLYIDLCVYVFVYISLIMDVRKYQSTTANVHMNIHIFQKTI